MTTTNPPRTRKQLRTALADALRGQYEAEDNLAALEQEHERAKARIDRLNHDLTAAEGIVTAAGHVRNIPRGLATPENVPTWTLKGDPKLYTQADFDAHRADVVQNTRRDTLEEVIEALNLTEYKGHVGPSAALLERFGVYPTTTHADRFWDDINTALEVRAADKKVAEQRAAADRISKLAPIGALTVDGSTLAERLSATGNLAQHLVVADAKRTNDTAKPKKPKTKGGKK